MRPGELGLGILSYACVLFAMLYELTQHARLSWLSVRMPSYSPC